MTSRTGLANVWRDHVDSWSLEPTPAAQRAAKQRAAVWYFATPAPIALTFLCLRVHLQGVAQLVAGSAIFTGLLFGLLTLAFNTAVTLKKEGQSFEGAHGLGRVISDLRANLSYAICVALLLTSILVVAAALTPPTTGLAWGWTPLIIYVFGHLLLTVLTVLKRYRTAFNYLSR